MESLESKDKSVTPVYIYANWKAAKLGRPRVATIEAPLFSDSEIFGEIRGLGPYSFLNTIAHAGAGDIRALRNGIVLRAVIHDVEETSRVPMENDFEHYHGGDHLDELAALASLVLGIRLQAGAVNREFVDDGDPLGRPFQYSVKAQPILVAGRGQIPRIRRGPNLDELRILDNFAAIEAAKANCIIKAARMYQQAIWISDSDPGLAWLLLVSAVETTAVEWRESTGTPTEQLELAMPVLATLIESKCPELVESIAVQLSRLTKATKRFVDFLVEFAPKPPLERPPDHVQFKYEELKQAASIIYDHRSRALHDGTAFPAPMCWPPHRGVSEYQEVPFGLASGSGGATWTIDKTPMLLNTFEHIARGALLNWWNTVRQEA